MVVCSTVATAPCGPVCCGRRETLACHPARRTARFKGRLVSFRIAHKMSCLCQWATRMPANYFWLLGFFGWRTSGQHRGGSPSLALLGRELPLSTAVRKLRKPCPRKAALREEQKKNFPTSPRLDIGWSMDDSTPEAAVALARDFAPVASRKPRHDGWTEARSAALSCCSRSPAVSSARSRAWR